MKKIAIKLFAGISFIITAVVAGTPLTGYAAPEVAEWTWALSGSLAAPSGLSNVVAIAAGPSNNLALTAEGQVVAWGLNNSGQTDVPSGLSNVVAIAAGGAHCLALTADGQVVAWGDNSAGQTDVPSGLSNVVAIAAGNSHSMALMHEGRLVEWGKYYNSSIRELVTMTVPSGLSNVVGIAAGGNHSLALTSDGQVLAWGDNSSGQTNVPSGLSNVVAIAAGHNNSLALTAEGRVVAWGMYSVPFQWASVIVPSGLSDVVAIASAGDHSLALTADGQVVAWGLAWYSIPEVSSYVLEGLSNVVGIAAGQNRNLTLSGLPPGVAAPAWAGPQFLIAAVNHPFHHRIMTKNGATAYGASGLPSGLALDPHSGLITGQTANAGKYDVVLSATNSVGWCEWTVTLFVNGTAAPQVISSGVVQARLGNAFSYAVVAYNAPEWYGTSGLPAGLVIDAHTGLISGVPLEVGDFVVSLVATNRGGLGRGSFTIQVSSVSPIVAWGWNYAGETNVPGGMSNVVAMAAGKAHSLALTAEGRVVHWGAYSMALPNGLSNVVAIAAGEYHSLALTAEGRVVAWGLNNSLQANVPSGLSNVVAIAGGEWYSLALTAEGRVVAWGHEFIGSTPGPMPVPGGLSNLVAIAAGGSSSDAFCLALTADGQVVQWGQNQTNVLSGLSNVVAIAAGGFHGLALTADGHVVSWGSGSAANVPSGLSNVVAIAAAGGWASDGIGGQSLALTADGRVVGWGAYLDMAYHPLWLAPVPSDLSNVVAIAAGWHHCLALLRQPTVPTPRLELSRGLSGLELQAQGAPGISCQLLHASHLPGPWLPDEPVTFTNNSQFLRTPDASEPAQFFRLLRK